MKHPIAAALRAMASLSLLLIGACSPSPAATADQGFGNITFERLLKPAPILTKNLH